MRVPDDRSRDGRLSRTDRRPQSIRSAADTETRRDEQPRNIAPVIVYSVRSLAVSLYRTSPNTVPFPSASLLRFPLADSTLPYNERPLRNNGKRHRLGYIKGAVFNLTTLLEDSLVKSTMNNMRNSGTVILQDPQRANCHRMK